MAFTIGSGQVVAEACSEDIFQRGITEGSCFMSMRKVVSQRKGEDVEGLMTESRGARLLA